MASKQKLSAHSIQMESHTRDDSRYHSAIIDSTRGVVPKYCTRSLRISISLRTLRMNPMCRQLLPYSLGNLCKSSFLIVQIRRDY